MEPRDLENAAAFCKLVDTPDLLSYLGVDQGDPPSESRAKLKSRRRFMQGMQSNPKYKQQALFLIKHFASLDRVLSDPEAYLLDVSRRAESQHLPVLELTVRSVLSAGAVAPTQVDYLRRNASELGVSAETFSEVLARIASEMGVGLPDEGAPDPDVAPTLPSDPYQALGIEVSANNAGIKTAFAERLADLGEAARPALEAARDLLLDPESRRQYDFTAARTGPPARSRVATPDLPDRDPDPDTLATAPPVQPRASAPGGGHLEILGDPVRVLTLGDGISVATVTVRNGGVGEMGGLIVSDVPWMAVDPTRLDPTALEQTISVQVDRADVPDHATAGVITIRTQGGEQARVVFEIGRPAQLPWLAVAVAIGAVVLVLLLALLLAWM